MRQVTYRRRQVESSWYSGLVRRAASSRSKGLEAKRLVSAEEEAQAIRPFRPLSRSGWWVGSRFRKGASSQNGPKLIQMAGPAGRNAAGLLKSAEWTF